MQVIKRDGRIQEFDMTKIETSIMRASDDIKEPMPQSDARVIAKDIAKLVGEKYDGKIDVKAIHILVMGDLIKKGFLRVANAYGEGYDH